MAFDYSAVEQITNQDFKSSHLGLRDQCAKIEQDYQAGELRKCCGDVRLVLEDIIRYMYKRKMGFDSAGKMVGQILHDSSFKVSLNNAEIIRAADRVNETSKKYHHARQQETETQEQYTARIQYENSQELPVVTEELLTDLSKFLSLSIAYINDNISGSRGKVNFAVTTVLNQRTMQSEKWLEADLQDVDNRADYKYLWEIKDKGRPGNAKGRSLYLPPTFAGEVIIFKAVNEKTGHEVAAEYGPLKSDEVTIGGKVSLTGSIEISHQEKIVNGRKRYSLKADVVECNSQGPFYFTWNSYPDKEEIFRGHQKDELFLQKEQEKLIGKKVSCIARSAEKEGNWTGYVRTKQPFGPLTEEMFGNDNSLPKVKPPVLSLSVERNDGRKVLYALGDGEHMPKENVTFQWTIRPVDGEETISQYRGPHLVIETLSAGCIITCTATSKLYTEAAKASITLSEDDLKDSSVVAEEPMPEPKEPIPVKEAPKEEPPADKPAPEPPKATEIEPPETPAAVEPAAPAITKPSSKPAAHKPTENVKKPAPKPEKRPLKFEEASYAMTLPKSLPKLFDATNSLIHYFVSPSDKYVLNSLEMVCPEFYLYRLLRHEGYEHIVFVEVENNKNLVIVYDEESANAFEKRPAANQNKTPAVAAKAAPRGMMGRSVAKTEQRNAAAPTVSKDGKRFGKRQLRMFSTPEEFIKLFTIEISNALEDNRAKTAIVMPLTIFDKTGYSGDAIIDTVRRLDREHMGKNILLLTMPRRGDLLHCYRQNQAALHPWTQDVQNIGSEEFTADRVNQAIRLLDRRIVVGDRYEVDEIANLLFRKIIIERNETLSRIDEAKIYTVAEQLKEHCQKEKEHYRNIPNNNMSERLITQLDKILNDKEYATIIADSAEKVKTSRIATSERLHPLCLERVYHMGISRYEGEGTLEEIQEQFDKFSGEEMQSIIAEIRGSVDFFLSEKQRIERRRDAGERVEDDEMPFMNMVFLGSPGTGKTSIAKLTARYLKAKGVLKKGNYVYTTASSNIQGVVGATAANIRQKAEEAIGGVLFIDEFQGFNEGHSAGNIAENVMREIVSIVNTHRSDLCIIVAGYKDGVENVMKYDEGAGRRFPIKVNFNNYSVDTLLEIFHSLVKQRGETVEEGVDDLLAPIIESRITEDRESFGNAGYIKDILLPALGRAKSSRSISSSVYTATDVKAAFPNVKASEMTEEEILKQFDKYIGDEMQAVKDSVIGAADFFLYEREIVERKRKRGEKVDDDALPFMNMVFVGNPGTGKTSIAKLTAKYFKVRGVMPTNRFVYRSASQMIQGVVGGTAEKIREAAEEARGGVLFIDEFQGFNEGHSAGNIAENVMREIVSITNVNKGKLCIILGGYKRGVESVLRYDEGSARRFPRKVEFKNYSVPTLMKILDNLLKDRDEELEPAARPLVEQVMENDIRDLKERFGNGGYVRDVLLGKLTEMRLQRDRSDRTYRVEDVKKAFPDKITSYEKPVLHRVARQEFEDKKVPYSTPTEGFTSQSLNALVEPSVLFIKTDKGAGTGFLVSKNGYALTCNHVIEGATSIQALVRIPKENRENTYECQLVFTNVELDMAVIKLNGDDFPYLPLAAEDRELVKGENFILVGYPFGERTKMDTSLYNGTLASFQKDPLGWDVVTINGEAKAGNSGSPLVALSDGKVIGLLRGSWDEHSGPNKTEEINFMRPIKYFWKEMLK